MLTLILQTQEGHQIELNVQPEDTFADLQSQYADHEVFGLSDSLQHLITNGANVAQNTKIFDYVTGSAHEWLSTNALEEARPSESTEVQIEFRECCARGCPNSNIATPGKQFYPLPTDRERLSVCLIEIDRPDLYSKILSSDEEESQKYFLCGNHIGEELSLITHDVVEEQVSKPKNDFFKSNATEEKIIVDDEDKCGNCENNECHEIDFNARNSSLDIFEEDNDFQHPGILCRLCGKIADNPVHLYAVKTENIDEEFSIADKINLCLPVTITVTDPLPKQICQDCHVKLDICHDLALSSLRTEDELKTMLKETKLCLENNVQKQCPLCVEGEMKVVTKSGIYRREDLKDDFFSIETEKNGSSEKNFKNIAQGREVQLPILDNTICESRTNDTFLIKSQSSNENISLPLPIGEFNCSICSSRIVDFKAIKTHNCNLEDGTSTYSCIICKNKNFKDPLDLAAHYSIHGLENDESLNRYNSTNDGTNESVNPTRIFGKSNNWEINHEDGQKKYSNEEILKDHREFSSISYDLAKVRENNFVVRESNNETSNHSKSKAKCTYACHFCDKKFTRKGSLEKHIVSLHNDSSKDSTLPRCYKCKVCCEAFEREIDAKSHTRLKHLSESSKDDSNPGKSEFLIEQLIVTCLYTCEFCEHSFTIPKALHEHRESEHSKNLKYLCVICNTNFDSHRQLATHKTLRLHKKPIDNYTGIKQFYVCKYCDKTFLHNSSHSSHLLLHSDAARPYLCRICNVNFSNYQDISKHRDSEHPYQSTLHERSSQTYNCQYCRKQFGQEVALMKHIRMHTGERPYKCTICGKGFSQSSGLYTHLRIHSDLRPYSCTKCPRTFKIKGDRDNHIKKHAGNRPYKCEFCNKAFMTQHVYSQHCKIHTGERPYKCDICGQAFRRSHVLTVHMRRHTGEKPHVCDLCPKTYRQRGDLSKHRKIQHGISNLTNKNSSFESHNREDDNFQEYEKIDKLGEIFQNPNSFFFSL